MQRNTITTVTSISEAISNLASGDIVFFDIDGTLILTGYEKFSDAPRLTEPGLAAAILRLQERGIHVVGLSARAWQDELQTVKQLEAAGINISVIYVPDIHQAEDSKLSAHTSDLRRYLSMLEVTHDTRTHF